MYKYILYLKYPKPYNYILDRTITYSSIDMTPSYILKSTDIDNNEDYYEYITWFENKKNIIKNIQLPLLNYMLYDKEPDICNTEAWAIIEKFIFFKIMCENNKIEFDMISNLYITSTLDSKKIQYSVYGDLYNIDIFDSCTIRNTNIFTDIKINPSYFDNYRNVILLKVKPECDQTKMFIPIEKISNKIKRKGV